MIGPFRGTWLPLLAALVIASGVARAQSAPHGPEAAPPAGAITGTVSDQSGAVVPGARVSARNMDTGIQTTTRSNDVGQFAVSGLPYGNYELEVTAPGFTRYLIRITVSKDLSVAAHEATLQAGVINIDVRIAGGA